MLARDIATSRVVVVGPEQSLMIASQLMDQHLIGSLVVVHAEGSHQIPVGIITDRDASRLAVAGKLDAAATTVGAVMSHPPILCPHDASLVDIICMMHGSGIRRLPVVDDHGHLVGIVTANDALVALTQLMQQLTEVLVIEPSLKDRMNAMQNLCEACDGHRASRES